jgi:D-hexose-6-phosphate mutarotase
MHSVAKALDQTRPPRNLVLTGSYFGATVTSWKVDGQEKLFLSKKSSLDSTKPVSGMEVAEVGIPFSSLWSS